LLIDFNLIYNVANTIARHRSKNAQLPLNPPMGRLSLNFLGAPEVQYDGQPIAFPTRKALALLIYLAVEGTAQPRDKLTALLWPDSPGASTLRSTLTMLRKALGEAVSHVIADRDSLRFDLTPDVNFDLHTLNVASQLARQLPIANHRSLIAQLASVAILIRGDFLEGFSLADAPEFDDWASFQREALRRQAMHVFDCLSQIQFDGGEAAKAIETAARWAALDPLDEAAHRRLMLCHFTHGNRSAALQAYEACRARLKRELNVGPSPETEALVERIQTQPPPAREEAVGQVSAFADNRERHLPNMPPLVGRADEHTELVSAYRSARQGQTQIVLIEGEPGIGKTRLAKEFLAWTSAQGGTVLQGRAFEMGSQIPYQVVVDTLRSSNLQPLISNLQPIWLAELARLLPELHDLYPNLPAPLPLAETGSRSRLFEAIVRMGQALIEAAPARAGVTLIDDLQWADAASLDLLGYVARRWAANHTPALLILTARSEELAQLDPWLITLSRDLPLTRLPLHTLTLEDTRQLVQALEIDSSNLQSFGFAQDKFPISNLQSLIPNLYADTGGHPFFIIQTLNALSESDERQPPMPTGIRDLIRSRLSRLTPNASLLCATGAVFGAGFDFDGLCRVAELTESDGLPALEELLRRGLLRETPRRDVPVERLRGGTNWPRTASTDWLMPDWPRAIGP
jgi:DNA-binding SARP family transcriptional activator